MAAQFCGAATPDGAQHLQMLIAEPRLMLVDEAVTLRVNDVGHLHGGPRHERFCSFRERFTLSGPEMVIVSKGLTTASRCFRDRCRYTVVCLRSEWPSSTWIVRRSVPASSKWVAKQWRKMWGDTRLSMPAFFLASCTASQTTFGVIGLSARQLFTVP